MIRNIVAGLHRSGYIVLVWVHSGTLLLAHTGHVTMGLVWIAIWKAFAGLDRFNDTGVWLVNTVDGCTGVVTLGLVGQKSGTLWMASPVRGPWS